ncbi:hypothetical protein K443DRAFT_7464 [Laccaria amethystina LaAM-08-1]|uniref:Uncharacterized protein n=1 Tax=Laccaria amethystina LaAM-08-1 TaxID=1095629 RepID=A0A0C9XSG9_9AGAR|nr:hypothetical protein K443DRAFT_7464 [Laccaria amethystina LaAM-08-1]
MSAISLKLSLDLGTATLGKGILGINNKNPDLSWRTTTRERRASAKRSDEGGRVVPSMWRVLFRILETGDYAALTPQSGFLSAILFS